jgi:NADPH-dependent 2,4-dienoyl-CoA reductase/sulfur reductase-like enzyme/nitrite reductase/ring-hydroxylating ferredoxin subunit
MTGSSDDKKPPGPDLSRGVPAERLRDGEPLLGHAGSEAIVLVRSGGEIFAVGASCTHYGGPLAEGLVVGDTIRCPWHHARFSLRSGAAEGAPALSPVGCWDVEQKDGIVRVSGECEATVPSAPRQRPSSVVIVGAGAAGAACADMLRAKGFAGPITLVGDEEPGPVDRPNLSKDYLAGNAPEDWIPLRTRDYYASIRVELLVGDPVESIDTSGRTVTLRGGRALDYGSLLLATGAEARTLPIEGANLPNVFRLRTLADSRAIIAAAEKAKRAVVIGSSFIGLEVAASLRHRELDVTVVGADKIPLERVLGPEVGGFVRRLHESHGVRFRLETSPEAIRRDGVALGGGETLPADLVVVGVGVSPRTGLAGKAGLKIDNGIVVDESLRASAPDVYAAGDAARFPERVSGEPARIEHWALAERQGQAVARAMLGIGGPFRDVPFFWSQHYDVAINYVGHAVKWEAIEIRGDLEARRAAAIYRRGRKVLAVATVGRDHLSLAVEAAMERGDDAAVEAALRENG